MAKNRFSGVSGGGIEKGSKSRVKKVGFFELKKVGFLGSKKSGF